MFTKSSRIQSTISINQNKKSKQTNNFLIHFKIGNYRIKEIKKSKIVIPILTIHQLQTTSLKIGRRVELSKVNSKKVLIILWWIKDSKLIESVLIQLEEIDLDYNHKRDPEVQAIILRKQDPLQLLKK